MKQQIYWVAMQPLKSTTSMFSLPMRGSILRNMLQLSDNGPPQHVWDQLAPGTEANRANSLAEGSQSLTEVSDQDLVDNANFFTTSTTSTIHTRYECSQ